MKYALIADNKIIDIIEPVEKKLQGWQQVSDEAKLGDVFDSRLASREDNLRSEMPSLEKLIVTLWESIISGDTSKRDDLESQRQQIIAKYPKA